jgi:hypothetical protein
VLLGLGGANQMGTLVVDQIDLNDVNIVNNLKSAIQKLVSNPSSYYSLKFKPQYYFETPNSSLPSEMGWYIILHNRMPVYVGRADDLNARLNTNNGSLDNFAKQGRKFELERNLIKKFDELNIFETLRVCVIQERSLCSELGLNSNNLTKLDRGSIEKLINIFKCIFTYR